MFSHKIILQRIYSEDIDEREGRFRRRRLLSTSLSVSEIEAVKRPPTPLPLSSLVLRRVLAALVMLAILVAGIIVRILFPAQRVSDDVIGVTSGDVTNSTDAYVTPGNFSFTETFSLSP